MQAGGGNAPVSMGQPGMSAGGGGHPLNPGSARATAARNVGGGGAKPSNLFGN